MGEVEKKQPLWYLPHHPVFDCAANCAGIALNDRRLQGPDLTTPLIEVLCRFRLGSIAVAADIEEMFMQVKVPKGQRGALRLWWWPDGDLDGPAQEYQMTVHPFDAIFSPFCANFALKTTVNRFAQHFETPVGSCVEHNFYVDDFLGSFESIEEAVRHIRDLSKLLLMGGFKVTKWMSNSVHAIDCVPVDERAPSLRELQGNP
ncbi:unnamed protein product [Echinostoma caproni]|uniref:Reverse transcriptase domain-containing protein n=1 Tax=Echinostoma caproni TaxID=27848 RepID=A0A183B4I1_9TREM|nr:unnamed protein product [Echinostoma caproni]